MRSPDRPDKRIELIGAHAMLFTRAQRADIPCAPRNVGRTTGVSLEPFDYTIDAAAPCHLEVLPLIELAAASCFRGYDVPPTLFTETTPLSVFADAQASGHLRVALSSSGACVGFGLFEAWGERLHLQELDVSPEHGRRGVGTALVRDIERWAVAHGFAEVNLTTYRDVPWNGPFYRRLGYTVVRPEDLGVELAARLEAEAARGLDSLPRVAMRKPVGPPTGTSTRCAGAPR